MNSNYPQIYIKPEREKSLQRRHPWVFSGSILKMEGEPATGDTIEVLTSHGEFIAWAAYSPHSQIRARVWSWTREEIPDKEFFRQRMEKAIQARNDFQNVTNALRLVYAESDGLPGLIVDKYSEFLVVQFLSSGVEFWRSIIVELLVEITGIGSVYERSDVEVRKLEGLELRTGLLAGEDPPELVQIHEHGINSWVMVRRGQKTGYYLDQRANRLKIRKFASNRHVLDAFSFSGGFGINALVGGASHLTMVDSSEEALKVAGENLNINHIDAAKIEMVEADVFQQLRYFRDEGRTFDLVVLDPPKFAPTRKQAAKAARAYKDINLLAFKLLRHGGILFTFSCSGGIDTMLFQRIIASAALDAKVEAQVIANMGQDADHPVALNFPEGSYLKGLVCRVL